MRFVKLHGCGNDYAFADSFNSAAPADLPALARAMSKPHTGLGSDGLIWLSPEEGFDARMRIFNADGSEAQICGNGLRCAGKYLYESGLARKERLDILTGAGARRLWLRVESGLVSSATADMGAPEIAPADISLSLDGRQSRFRPVSMGNPHAVNFELFPRGEDLKRLGSRVENDALFPNRVNVEFVSVLAADKIAVNVWERGSGATLCCGSGACASLAAAASLGLCARHAAVVLPGGELDIDWRDDDHIYMTGPAELAFTGEWPD